MKKIGLALGSGGVKGLAHVGVIKALKQNKIPIDYLAGASIGALVGAVYAATLDIEKIEKIIFETNWKHALVFIDPSLKSGGLVGGKKVEKLIQEWLGEIDFPDLKIPMTIVATDLITGQVVQLQNHNLIKAIRASSAVPPIFKPVAWQNYLLSDGGLADPLPIDSLKMMGAELTIGVNLDGGQFSQANNQEIKRLPLSRVPIRALNIMRYNLAKNCLKEANIIIEPEVPEIGLIGWNKFFNTQEVKKIVQAGETATLKVMPAIKKLLNQ